MTVILKLGGSVITEKDRPETLDGETLDALCGAIAAADVPDLVLVHGGGSFGHHHAAEYGVSTEAGTADAGAVLTIHNAMTTLNAFVLERLHDRGVPALPVHPLSAASRDADGELTLPCAPVGTLLEEGFVPVVHGDVIGHEGRGITVLSGDEIVEALARGLDADRVGFCSTVPGVLDDKGAVIPEIDSYDAVAGLVGGSDATDVTGGMAGKVRSLLALEVPAAIFGPTAVGSFLSGELPGTRIG